MAPSISLLLYIFLIELVMAQEPVTRRLVAGNVPPRLEIRDPGFAFNHQADFHFAQDALPGSKCSMGALLSVEAELPIFVLEDIEQEVRSILCSGSVIQLVLSSPAHFESLKQNLLGVPEFILVTAHEGCNKDGHRTPFLVSEISFNDDDLRVTMQMSELDWHGAFHTTRANFGSGADWSHIKPRNQNGLGKRQATETSQPTITPTLPFSTPPSTATSTSIVENIGFQKLDTVIMPPQIPILNQIIPQGVTQSCKNCTLTGSIEVTQGSFAIKTSNDITQDINSTIQFFEHGLVEIVANNLFANIELDTQLQPSAQLSHFTAHLPEIGLSPIEIPGVAVLGPLISPQIKASLTFTESMSFTYGFNVSVPNDSTFTINMTDLSSSSATGFSKSTIHALPFSATEPIPSLTFTISLSPQFLLGISLPAGSATGGIGAFLDLPQLSVNVTQLSGVNEKCESPPSKLTADVDKLFGNLTNVVPSVGLDVGVVGEFDVDAEGLHWSDEGEFTLKSTAYGLPTACLSFDRGRGTYVAASASATRSGAATATATATSKKSGAGRSYRNTCMFGGGGFWAWVLVGGLGLVLW